jgi:hypothetical protein
MGMEPLAPDNSQLPIMSTASAELEKASNAARARNTRLECAIYELPVLA